MFLHSCVGINWLGPSGQWPFILFIQNVFTGYILLRERRRLVIYIYRLCTMGRRWAYKMERDTISEHSFRQLCLLCSPLQSFVVIYRCSQSGQDGWPATACSSQLLLILFFLPIPLSLRNNILLLSELELYFVSIHGTDNRNTGKKPHYGLTRSVSLYLCIFWQQTVGGQNQKCNAWTDSCTEGKKQ